MGGRSGVRGTESSVAQSYRLHNYVCMYNHTGYYVYTTATHHFPGKVPKPNLEAMATKGAIYGGWSGNNR